MRPARRLSGVPRGRARVRPHRVYGRREPAQLVHAGHPGSGDLHVLLPHPPVHARGVPGRVGAELLALENQADADKEAIEPNGIYLAPSDYHLLVEPGIFRLSVDERVQHARPSVDVLFESVADSYRERAVGVILTGANRDGARGLSRIKELGGVAIVQDPADAEAHVMPTAAMRSTVADAVLPLQEIPKFLTGLCMEVGQRVG